MSNDYKAQARDRESMLTAVRDVVGKVDWTPAHQITALQSLVQLLFMVLIISRDRLAGGGEPYPGAAHKAAEQALTAVEIARSTGLMPHEHR